VSNEAGGYSPTGEWSKAEFATEKKRRRRNRKRGAAREPTGDPCDPKRVSSREEEQRSGRIFADRRMEQSAVCDDENQRPVATKALAAFAWLACHSLSCGHSLASLHPPPAAVGLLPSGNPSVVGAQSTATTKKAPRLGCFFVARSTEKDITGFFEKSACDKAFSDFFYIFSCSM